MLLFNLERVDRFLAQFSWEHKVTKSGQVSVGQTNYYIGQSYAALTVDVSFALDDRHFVFKHSQTAKTLKRCPAKKLDVPIITGLNLKNLPDSSQPFQLPLPW